MTAVVRSRSSGGSLLLLAFLVIAVALVAMAPSLVQNHADEKHGLDAAVARQWISQHGEFCKWSCPDGRDRFVCMMEDGRWAILILEEGVEITAFVTSKRGYALGIVEPCTNPWRYDHP